MLVMMQWPALCYCSIKTEIMNDIDFVRNTAMYILPICIERSANPVQTAVDYAQELLKECQKRESEENL